MMDARTASTKTAAAVMIHNLLVLGLQALTLSSCSDVAVAVVGLAGCQPHKLLVSKSIGGHAHESTGTDLYPICDLKVSVYVSLVALGVLVDVTVSGLNVVMDSANLGHNR